MEIQNLWKYSYACKMVTRHLRAFQSQIRGHSQHWLKVLEEFKDGIGLYGTNEESDEYIRLCDLVLLTLASILMYINFLNKTG